MERNVVRPLHSPELFTATPPNAARDVETVAELWPDNAPVGLNARVREYWEREPCGTSPFIVGGTAPRSREWFAEVERHRYQQEPHIFAAAQFTRWAGKKLLEVGVGAGCDHLQFARSGADCHGIDLTASAIETTRQHLALHGFRSKLRQANAESLPYPTSSFDLLYSWGVIHHSERPKNILDEIYRVLRPGGTFIGMMYARHSLVSYKLWARRALLAGKPWRSLDEVLFNHMESVGTKAYTPSELKTMFRKFYSVAIEPIATVYDRKWLGPLGAVIPNALGWNLSIRALR